jgi:aminoglycoside phosphotransferase
VVALPAAWRDLFRKSGRILDAALASEGHELVPAQATRHEFADGSALDLPTDRGQQYAAVARMAGEDIGEVLRRLGRSLRWFHGTDPAGCPWDRGVPELVVDATARVAANEVRPDRFDPPYRRYTPAGLLDLVVCCIPDPSANPVVIHGTARLSALRLDAGELRWANVGTCGLGDPYRDLATMAVDLASAISPEALAPFLDAYGVDHPDVVRLDWHVLVDQLLR